MPSDSHRAIGQKGRASLAALYLRKGMKETLTLGRRAAFGWRHLRVGVLAFNEPASGTRRTFAIGKKLGEGGYSTIWRVHEWQPDGSERQFAVKRIIIDAKDAEQVELVEHEVRVMRSLPPHPHVLELIGTCTRTRGGQGSGERSSSEIFMLLELCRGGSLAQLLLERAERGEALSEGECVRTFTDMALALAHLHAQSPPLAHRDVKPENFILHEGDARWRLCDFGSATSATFKHVAGMPSAVVAAEEELVHRCSTPQYRSPEMCDLRRGETIGPAADVWALGVCLYKLLYLRDLFGVAGEERLGVLNLDPAKKLADAALPPPAEHSGASSSVLRDLMRLCLTPLASRRPTVPEVLQWLGARRSQLAGARGGLLPFEERPTWRMAAGLLTLSALRFTAASDAHTRGVKPYVLLTCGGVRRTTPIAARGREAAWDAALNVATHALQAVELTVWASHRRATHDLLGYVPLLLPSVLPDPATPTALPSRSVPLEGRAQRSRVSGHLSFSLEWAPFLASPADATATAAHHQPHEPSPCATEACSGAPTAAAGGQPTAGRQPTTAAASAGSFWSSPFAETDAFDAIDLSPPIQNGSMATPAAAAASAGGSCGGSAATGPAATGSAAIGSFWETEAATVTCWHAPSTALDAHADVRARATSESAGFRGAGCFSAPPLSSPPQPIVWSEAAGGPTLFESVDALAAPWDGAATAAAEGGSGSFWASFDAAPQLAPLPPAAAAGMQSPSASPAPSSLAGVCSPPNGASEGAPLIDFNAPNATPPEPL